MAGPAAASTGPLDPDLIRLAALWPELPEAIRTAILTLADSARPRLPVPSLNRVTEPAR